MDCSGFITLGIYTPLGAVVLLTTNCMIAIDMGNTCTARASGFLPVVLHSDQPLSEGEIIPFSGVVPVRLHYPRRRYDGFTHWLTDCFDVQPTTTSGNIITQSIISALASANSFVYFASSAATSRWRIMSVIAAFASFSSLAFLSRWAL